MIGKVSLNSSHRDASDRTMGNERLVCCEVLTA
jgi:hypothetical protein